MEAEGPNVASLVLNMSDKIVLSNEEVSACGLQPCYNYDTRPRVTLPYDNGRSIREKPQGSRYWLELDARSYSRTESILLVELEASLSSPVTKII